MVTQRKSNIPPHHRLTLKDVIRDYRDGLLTAKGAVFYAVSASRKLGETVPTKPHHFSKVFGMSTRAYYKAVAQLKVQRRLDFDVEGTMHLKVPIEEKTGLPEYIVLEELGTNVHSERTNVHNLGTKIPDLGTKIPDLGTKIHKKSCDRAPSAASGSPLSIQSIQSLSPTDERERDKGLDANDEFRDWLRNKANSLPQKPVLLEQWVEKEAKKESNQKEYLQYQESLQRAAIPQIPLTEEFLTPQEYWKRLHERRNDG